jgi:hypothetical protein
MEKAETEKPTKRYAEDGRCVTGHQTARLRRKMVPEANG